MRVLELSCSSLPDLSTIMNDHLQMDVNEIPRSDVGVMAQVEDVENHEGGKNQH